MRVLLPLLLLASTAASAQPRLIAPADLSVPNPTPIRVEGLPPRAIVTLETVRRDVGSKAHVVAAAQFVADAKGRVHTVKRAPASGSYQGVDPLGLFWSAKASAAPSGRVSEGTVTIRALVGGKPVATASAAIDPDPGQFTTRNDTLFPGAIWALPRGKGPHPVMIVLGGSEGGNSTAREFAPLFAARGFATLGLPYYDPGFDAANAVKGLPKAFIEIPVDRLTAVKAWLDTQPEADTRRIGIWGVSKGAEFALIAASRYDWVKAVTAVVPTDLVWEGWGEAGPSRSSFAFGGQPLAFQPYAGMDAEYAKAAKGEQMDIGKVHRQGRVTFPDRAAAARIPIEAFKGPLLLIGGGRDAVWPSGEMAANIVTTRRKVGLPVEAIITADAGHALAGPGTTPVAPFAPNGGTEVANATTRAAGWRATFRLFDVALKPGR
jgi:dienelactone hydrolase